MSLAIRRLTRQTKPPPFRLRMPERIQELLSMVDETAALTVNPERRGEV